MNPQTHWEKIYREKAPDAVSWYRRHLETSLELIERAAVGRKASIIDVGGGESTLVDDLLARKFDDITCCPSPKCAPGRMPFEISDFQEDEIEATQSGDQNATMLHALVAGEIATRHAHPRGHSDLNRHTQSICFLVQVGLHERIGLHADPPTFAGSR